MTLTILEESPTRMVLVVESDTILRLVQKELWNEKQVKISGERMRHPLVGKPTLVVETDGKLTPRNALKDAVKRAKQQIDACKKSLQKG